MAAGGAYRASAATFASANLGPTIRSAQASEGGQPVDLVGDAIESIQSVFVDSIAADVTIVTTDVLLARAHKVGDSGSLVVTFSKRSEGKGSASMSDEVATFANAVLVSNSAAAGGEAFGEATLTFRCSAPAGGSPVSWATS